MRTHGLFPIFLPLLLTMIPPVSAQRGGRGGQAGGEALRFRFVGPAVGNRVAAVASPVGDPSTYYAGAASGGIFKSVDGGHAWTPIFDDARSHFSVEESFVAGPRLVQRWRFDWGDGHVRGIEAKLREIEQQDAATTALAAHLRTLILNFDLKRYMSVLEELRQKG